MPRQSYPHSWSNVPTMMEIVPDFYIEFACTARRHDNATQPYLIDSTVFPESYGDVEIECLKMSRNTLRPYKHRAKRNRKD